ncbi:hypothetical protein LG302_01515 [Halomonas organivorans]
MSLSLKSAMTPTLGRVPQVTGKRDIARPMAGFFVQDRQVLAMLLMKAW